MPCSSKKEKFNINSTVYKFNQICCLRNFYRAKNKPCNIIGDELLLNFGAKFQR